MRRLIPALLLLLAACQTGDKPNAAADGGPIAGPAVETTSLDAPKADAAKVDDKALAKAVAALPDPMAGGVVDASSETGTAAAPVTADEDKAKTDAEPVAPTAEEDAAQEPEAEEKPAGEAPDDTLDDALSEAEAEPEMPPELKTPEQKKCERQGGKFVAIGGNKNMRTCVKRTRDANKSCDADSDCQGKCLARSRTCAPIDPLLGCNEILNDYGLVLQECLQ